MGRLAQPDGCSRNAGLGRRCSRLWKSCKIVVHYGETHLQSYLVISTCNEAREWQTNRFGVVYLKAVCSALVTSKGVSSPKTYVERSSRYTTYFFWFLGLFRNEVPSLLGAFFFTGSPPRRPALIFTRVDTYSTELRKVSQAMTRARPVKGLSGV